MRGSLERWSEGSAVGSGAPSLIYLPQRPHQHSKRGQQKRRKDSLSPQNQKQSSMAPTLSAPIKQSRGISSWGQNSEAGPLPFCGHRSPEAGCAPRSCSQSSADASQPCAALSGVLTPPTRLALALSGPRVATGEGCQGDWLQEVAAQHSRRLGQRSIRA